MHPQLQQRLAVAQITAVRIPVRKHREMEVTAWARVMVIQLSCVARCVDLAKVENQEELKFT